MSEETAQRLHKVLQETIEIYDAAMQINIGDYVRFKDFKYLKKHHPDRFRWRLFELSKREAKIIGVHPDGSFIVDIDKTFPVTRDMFTKLSKMEVDFINAYHLKH